MPEQASDELPLAIIKLPESDALNARLAVELLTTSETVADKGSNMADNSSFFDNKWLSNPELHKSANVDILKIAAFVEQSANQMIQQSESDGVLSIKTMWCMVGRAGLVGKRHDHAAHVSAAYYVDAGTSGVEDGGMLQFFGHRESHEPTKEVKPESGILFLFPGSLEHAVSTYTGTQPRIVISVNLVFDSAA